MALSLANVLKPYHTVWIDWESIEVGEDWERAIARGIRRCDIFLFLASDSSCQSTYCQQEIQQALLWRKPIIPVVMENGLVLPKSLARLQWIFWDDSEKAIRKLLISTLRQRQSYWKWIALAEAVAICLALLASLLQHG